MTLPTNLVRDPGTKLLPSSHRDCSAAVAPIRALTTYLESLTFPLDGHKRMKFAVVRALKAEPEDLAAYPAAAVFMEGEAQYGMEDGALQPIYDPSGDLDDGSSLFLGGEVRVDLQVHVWTNEIEERENVMMALEDAFTPVEWMSGFLLEMPHYYNLRASYQFRSMSYEDTDADNQRRYRKLGIRIQATCPYARVFTLPRLRPAPAVEVS